MQPLTNSMAKKRTKILSAKLQLPDEYLGPSSQCEVENSFGKDTRGENKSPLSHWYWEMRDSEGVSTEFARNQQ